MESPVKRRTLKHLPLTLETDMISADVALYQAAHVLDLAATEALKQKDINALTHIAELWMIVAKSMEIDSEEEEQEKKIPFGFPASNHPIIERSEKDGEETH